MATTAPYEFEAIGTRWEIEINEPISAPTLAGLKAIIAGRIADFDQAYSRFRSDSLVTRISRHAGSYTLPPDAGPMLDIYEQLYGLTAGRMTPLIGQVLSDAGYDAAYSLQPQLLHTPPRWDEAISYAAPKLTVAQPALLDFGAAGKGHLIDIVAEIIQSHGIKNFVVDAGGDMLHRHPAAAAIKVGLEDPDDTSKVIGVVSLANLSLCGSAGNRRAWGQYNHIIDPFSLSSPSHLKAVWVTADKTLLADALTTALYFASPQTLAAHFKFEYAMLETGGRLTASKGFPAEFFIKATA